MKLPKKEQIPTQWLIDFVLQYDDVAFADYLANKYGLCVESLEVVAVGDKCLARKIKWDKSN
jgi:hypothetical protein